MSIGRARHRQARAELALPLAAVAVFVTAGAASLGGHWHPIGDFAMAELFVRELPHHLPLVGPYSINRGFSHPSPAFFYVAFAPYRIFGERSTALLAAALACNGVALGIAAWIAIRRGAVGVGIALVGCIALAGLGPNPSTILLPWNPYLAAVPFLALVVSAWAAWLGDRWQLPLAMGLGSWSIGQHLLFTLPVVGMWLVVIVGLVRATRGTGRWGALRTPALTALGVGIVLWFPTIWDLIRQGSDGNTAAIIRFVLHPRHGAVPASEALRTLSSELSLRPFWAGGARPISELGAPASTTPPLGLLVVAGTFLLAWRRRATEELTGILVGLTALGVCCLALTRVNDLSLLDWYLLPADMAGIALASFTAWSLSRSVLAWRRVARPGRTARVLAGACAVAALGALAVRTAVVSVPDDARRTGDAVAAIVPMIHRSLPRRRPVVVVPATRLDVDATTVVVLELLKAGTEVTVAPAYEDFFGPWWARPVRDRTSRIVVTSAIRVPPAPGARRITMSAPIPEAFQKPYRVAVWLLHDE
ncbi:MAG: hypothetical protein ACXVJW_10395 [Acidimicrobiia bacterium]